MKRTCPCCGFYTVDSEDEVIVDICPVCFWQYDNIAQKNLMILLVQTIFHLTKQKKTIVCLEYVKNNILIM